VCSRLNPAARLRQRVFISSKQQIEVGCADAQAHDVGNRDAQTGWKGNVNRKRRAARLVPKLHLCVYPLLPSPRFVYGGQHMSAASASRSRRTKVSRLLLRRHQPLKSIATRPPARPEEPRTKSLEAAMSYGEALAMHGGTGGKFRQGSDWSQPREPCGAGVPAGYPAHRPPRA
jgi:hypothetical protein